jgi:hypothetical protein
MFMGKNGGLMNSVQFGVVSENSHPSVDWGRSQLLLRDDDRGRWRFELWEHDKNSPPDHFDTTEWSGKDVISEFLPTHGEWQLLDSSAVMKWRRCLMGNDSSCPTSNGSIVYVETRGTDSEKAVVNQWLVVEEAK